MPSKSMLYKDHVKKEEARDRVEKFRDDHANFVSGIHFTIDELKDYVAKWEAILAKQPKLDPNGDYYYAVGHHFAYDKDNDVTFIVAPVLAHKVDRALTRDFLNAPKNTFSISDEEPYFFFNEGQKWP